MTRITVFIILFTCFVFEQSYGQEVLFSSSLEKAPYFLLSENETGKLRKIKQGKKNPIEFKEGIIVSHKLSVCGNYCKPDRYYVLEFKMKKIDIEIGSNFNVSIQSDKLEDYQEEFNQGIIYTVPCKEIGRTWEQYSCKFISKHKISRINFETESELMIDEIQLLDVSDSIRNTTNYVVNGDFEWFSRRPKKLYNGTYGLYGWNQFKNVKCTETRTEMHVDITIDQEGFVSNEFVDLGTPDFIVENNSGNVAGRFRCDDFKVPKGNAPGEFLQTQFTKKFTKNKKYRISFSYKLDSTSKIASNGLGLKITDCLFSPFDKELFEEHLFHEPTFMVSDSISINRDWINVEFVYEAKGGENYITFGPFSKTGVIKDEFTKLDGVKRSEKLAIYVIDNVVVEEI
jgi:hypothetical protein